jgi:hypothetical protein
MAGIFLELPAVVNSHGWEFRQIIFLNNGG